MELNFQLIEKMRELDVCRYNAEKINSKTNEHSDDNECLDDLESRTNNVFETLTILNDLFELEPNVKIRDLHYKYLDFLEKEEYVKCFNIVDELKKIK